MDLVIPLRQVDLSNIGEVGGKNASLGELLQSLDRTGIRVPDGFAVTAGAFRLHLERAGIAAEIYSALDALEVRDVAALRACAARVRETVRSAPLPPELEAAVLRAYRELSLRFEEEETDVAVRSSATAEDLPTASFAGQQETYLNVRGRERLLRAVKDCMASL